MAAYDEVIRGISIPIGADMTPFGQAIEESGKKVDNLVGHVKTLEKSLKINWNESEAQKAQDQIQKAIELTKQSASDTQEMITKMGNPDTKEGQRQLAALHKKANELNLTLVELNKHIEIVGHTNVDSLKRQFDDAAKSTRATQSVVSALRSDLARKWDEGNFTELQNQMAKAVQGNNKQIELLNARLKELESLDTDRAKQEIEELKKEIIKAELAGEQLVNALAESNKLPFDNIKNQLDSVSQKLDGFGNAIMPVSAALAAGFTFAAKAAVEMDTALVGVQKTTDFTADELQNVKHEIIDLSKEIPVAATELANIAENAGQLGIKKDNILGFTRVMADLGATTNLAGAEAAQTFAKFANITQMSQQDFDRLGSAIVDVGNKTATTEKDIANMALRIASAGTQAGFTEAQIIGMAAAASSLGLEAEAGGTAFQKTINAINIAVKTGSDDMAEYAAVAGMSATQFKTAWETDAAGAFVNFIEGLNTATGGVVVKLDELGFSAARQGDALTRAAGAGDLFRNTMELSSTAWSENTALAKEAETRYGSAASQIAILKNEVTALGIEMGDRILPSLINLVKAGGDAVQWLSDLDESTGGAVVRFGLFIAALGPATKISGQLVETTANLVAVLGKKKVADDAVTASQIRSNAAMAANPAAALAAVLGILISVIGSLVVANALAGSSAKSLAEQTDSLNKSTADYIEAANRAKTATEELSEAEKLLTREKTLQLEIELMQMKLKQSDIQQAINKAEEENADLVVKAKDSGELALTYKEKYLDIVEALNDASLTEAERQERINKLLEDTPFYNVEALRGEIESLADETESYSEKIKDNNSVIDQGNASLSAYENTVLALTKTGVKPLEEAADDLGITLDQLNELLKKTSSSSSEAGDGVDSLAGSLENSAERAANFRERFEAAEAKAREEAEKRSQTLKTLSSELESTAKSYEDLSIAEGMNAGTAAQMLSQYQDLITANMDLIAQNPSLIAAISDQNTLTKNSAEIARSTWQIKQAILRQELEASLASIESQITATKTWRDNMVSFYGSAAAASKAFFDIQISEGAASIQSLEAQATLIRQTIEKIGSAGNIPVSTKKTTKKAKTPEELALEELKSNREKLDYEYKKGLLSDEEYLKARIALFENPKYFPKNTAGWRAEDLEIDALTEKFNEATEKQRQQNLSNLVSNLNEQKITLEQFLEDYSKLQSEYYERDSAAWVEAEEKKAAASKKELDRLAQESYNTYRKLADDVGYLNRMKLISDAEYLDELARLRDEYLDETSEEWQKATNVLYNYGYDFQAAAVKKSYNLEKARVENETELQRSAIEEGIRLRREAVKEQLQIEQQRLNAIISGIDDEINARRRLREDESQDEAIAKVEKRVVAARAEVDYARDEESRREALNELTRQEEALAKLKQDKDDTAFYREKEQEKELYQTQLQNAQQAANDKLESLNNELEERIAVLDKEQTVRLDALQAAYDYASGNDTYLHEQQLTFMDEEHRKKLLQLQEEYEQAFAYQRILASGIGEGRNTGYSSSFDGSSQLAILEKAAQEATSNAISATKGVMEAMGNLLGNTTNTVTNQLSVQQTNHAPTTTSMGLWQMGNFLMDMLNRAK